MFIIKNQDSDWKNKIIFDDYNIEIVNFSNE